MKLIIMSCSNAKRPDSAPLTALRRYDGPMWRTLRALLDRHPAARSALAAKDLEIWVLSGLFGFIPVDVEVPNYDRRLTAEAIAKMARDPSYDFQRVHHFVDRAEAVLFAGGELYRDAMWKASGGSLWNIAKVSETDGAGIGIHRAQMGAWFDEHYREPNARLAA